jgi:hypothetical protein
MFDGASTYVEIDRDDARTIVDYRVGDDLDEALEFPFPPEWSVVETWDTRMDRVC